jgi:hypothetical protein
VRRLPPLSWRDQLQAPFCLHRQWFRRQMRNIREVKETEGEENVEAENKKHNNDIERMVVKFIIEESGLNHLPVSKNVKDKTWQKQQ